MASLSGASSLAFPVITEVWLSSIYDVRDDFSTNLFFVRKPFTVGIHLLKHGDPASTSD